jgi:hypothetical protein
VGGLGGVDEHRGAVRAVVVIGELVVQRVDQCVGAAGRERVPAAVGVGAGVVGATGERGLNE